MNKCFIVSPASPSGGYAKSDQMSKKVSNASHASLSAQNRDCKGPGQVTTRSQKPRERSLSIVSTSNVASHSHQRRWSADFCKCGTPPVIIVRKNKKEPQPPQRGISLLLPNTASHPSFKRYSCPPIGVFRSPIHPSSSSSSSSTSSCSSPPPVKTSAITGHDPLGWKLRPMSSSSSHGTRSKRLSLQIPLPVVLPDSTSSPAPNSQSDNTPNLDTYSKSKPPLRPKPFRRHHSDSTAFVRSLPSPIPVVTLEELCAVKLHPVTLSNESDDVFREANEEEVKVTTRPRKIPPPVPEKTFLAIQRAKLITHSRQCCKINAENTSVIKPKSKPSRTEDHSSLHDRKTAGLRADTSCDRERSTPRFPG